MSQIAQQIAEMVNVLPENEQTLAFEMVKRLVLAWDPDYTKLTAAERQVLDKAKAEYDRGETTAFDDVNWS